MTSLEEHAMVEIRSFLHECQPKMRSFELTAADIQNPILASAIAGLDLPVLHQASYEIGSSNYHTTTFQIPRMPQLRSISITGRVFPQVHSGSSMEEDSPFRYNELTRLTLHRCTLHELHFKQLMDFISYAPSLSHLSFIVVGVDGHAHEVNVQAQPTRERRTFASIRHLTFRQVSITHLDRIFEIIDSFQLETIELGDLNEPVYAWLKDKGTVFPSVRRFTISPENTSPTHVVDVHGLALLLMEVFPHLTDVEIPYWRAKLLTDWMVHFPPPETDPVKARGLPVSQDSSAMELPWVGIRSIRVTKEPTDDLGMEIALGHLVPFARRSKPFLKTPLRVIIEWRRSSATPCSRIMMKALESVIGRTRW
ncbi:hypothetical protein FRB90_003649 [Tulasnella sp. 427]|nr:hypothetical protein FRB90_003649 [Tulasnella sp. 427]